MLGSHGLTNTSSFKIQTNAHAFKLLSSGLYSDKIAAVLREIGCNAADAHIEYGSPTVPIIVKLPNRIDNQFYIRDMGPGLSHEDVMNLYTTYFASTKQNSNDYTGAFGLGSKSPFSYTDNFTVTSVHNGIERSYTAYLDNKGSPTISKLTENPASPDWPHGVQIGFPVKPDDFQMFEARAQNIYRWFKVPPKIEGARGIQPIFPKYTDPNGHFEYHPGNINGTKAAVLMGNVLYPLDLTKAEISYNQYGRNSDILAYAHFFPGIVLKLKIGDVQVAASREELQYDEDSRKVIKERMTEVVKFIGNNIAEKLRNAKTWEEKCGARDTIKMWGTEMWNASWQDFFKALGAPDALSLAGMAMNERVSVPAIMGAKSLAKIITLASYNRRKSTDAEAVRPGDNSAIRLHGKTSIYYGEKTLAIVRVRTLFDNNAVSQVLLFTPDKLAGHGYNEAKAEAFTVAQELGIPRVDDIATVALPPNYVPAVKKKYKKKGAVLPPLPSVKVMVSPLSLASSNVTISEDISTLPTGKQNFMVISKGSGWSRSDRMRVYEKTAETDQMFEMEKWNELWTHVSVLGKEISSPLEGHVRIYAAELSKFDLVRRGWKTTYAAIKEWLELPKTQAAIVKAASNWKPSMKLDMHHSHGWAGELVYLRSARQDIIDEIKPLLVKQKLWKQVEFIHDASVKQGANAGLREPKVLAAYRNLASIYSLPPIVVKQNGNFISIDDFHRSILERFPLSVVFDYTDFRRICEAHPEDAEKFLKFILSKEK